MNGPPAEKVTPVNPESIHGAWIGLREFGHHVDFSDTAGLKLDGQHISLDKLMIFTNRIRREKGLPPVGRKKEWVE
ncbi:MAG TPA: hypothetical protein VFE62_03045 [Gemmataceae bacterium]|nr:hypothetical protein [Gemmataceae bacterium]